MLIKNIGRGCVQLVGGLGAGIAIIIVLVAWQLHKGPVSLSFLTPYVEQALNSGHRGFQLAFDDTTLTWAGWDRAVELRVTNVRALDPTGSAIAKIPELSLALSGNALLSGTLAPKYIELLGPDLRLRRQEDGGVDFALVTNADGQGDVGERVATGLIGWLLRSPEDGSPMSHLDTVRITGATMTYQDSITGDSWEVPVGHFVVNRAAHGLSGEGSVLIEVDGQVSDIAISGVFHESDRRLDTTVTFAEISPDAFAGLSDHLQVLDGIEVPLSGALVLGVSLDGHIDTVGFNVTGAGGTLNLPSPVNQSIAVDQLKLRGLYDGRTEVLQLDEASVTLPNATTLFVPAPVSHAFSINSFATSARVDIAEEVLEFKDTVIELNGPRFVTSGVVSRDEKGKVSIGVRGELTDVPVDNVEDYWPQSMGSDAHAWVTENLAGGTLRSAEAEVLASIDPEKGLQIEDISGTMIAMGVDVTYMKGLPPVSDAAALMTFDQNIFDIAVERGRTGDIMVAGGTVHISGLQDEDQYADIDIRVESSLKDALELIDHEPLGFAQKMGIDFSATKGQSEIDLSLRLLLAKDLTLDMVEVSANAELRGVHMPNVVLGRGVRDGELTLVVDKEGMDVRGSVTMEDIPADLAWRENFLDDAPFKANFVLSASIDDVHKLENLGIHAAPLTHEYISGGADAIVRYTIFDRKRSRVDVSADIAQADLVIPLLNWRKAKGDPGRASVTILIENNLIKSVPSFEVIAGDLSVVGDIVYGPGGLGLERVNFERVQLGRTDVSGAIISRADGGWELGLQGPSIDISPLWDRVMNDRAHGDDDVLPNVTVAVEFERVWVDRNRFMTDVSGTFVHRHDLWRTVLLDTKLNGVDPFTVRIAPDDTGNRVLSIRAENAGDSLRFLDLFENMHGGLLEIRGRYDDAAPGHPLRGELRAANYRVRNAPLLTRVLSIMALTGILEALTGEGLNFTQLEIPFIFREGELEIIDASAAGPSLGFTASGIVYTHADVIDLSGTVVPVYALNSLLGNIPILGDILTGTEEGGGVFAANFAISGPIEDPTTTVNPLSALTPGIFRNLFGALTPDDSSNQPPSILDTPDSPLLAR